MKEKTTKILDFMKKRKVYLIIAVLAGGAFFVFGGQGDSGENTTYMLVKAPFEKSISVSGKVIPTESANLSFETGGTVSRVYKDIGKRVYQGEVIASLNAGELQADKEKAEADLLAAKAELSKLQSGGTDQTEVLNKKRALVDAILDAYTKADDAVRSKVDQYFENGTDAPEIRYTFEDYFDRKIIINNKRQVTEESLVKWQTLIRNLSVDNYKTDILTSTRKYLLVVKDFLDTISPAVATFEVSSILSQADVDKYKTDLYTAKININTSISNLTTEEEKLRGSLSDVPVQEAKVRSAEANVKSYDAQIRKTLILAPFTGIVSLQDAEVGESVSANTVIASVISENYEVELYVPEVSIVGIKLQNKGVVTLDADQNKKFEGVVTHIDPAETLKDGVSNYKVKLSLTSKDPIIRSGMTADVSIVTDLREDVISIPERAVVKENEKSFVYKYLGEKTSPEKVEIQIGERDGKGNVELLGGLIDGDTILLTPLL